MTEPDKKGDMRFLDEVEEEPKKGGSVGKAALWAAILAVGIASSFWWGRGQDSKPPMAQVSDPKAAPQDPQDTAIIGFAEKFAIMAFNLSYTDISHQTEKVGNLLSDNMMSYYQEAFLDPKWMAFLRDNRAYVSYQQVERSTIENRDGTHYWVQVIGKCLYNSDTRGPGSQIELPFHLIVVVKNDNGRLVVTDFQRL